MNNRPFILIAEDDPDYVVLIRETLSEISNNIHCLFFENGEDMLAFLKQGETLPSLIITDISMPKLDGFEVVKEVKEDLFFSEIPIAIYSHSSSLSDKERAFALNCNGYYTKGSCAKEIENSLSNMLKLMHVKLQFELLESCVK